jgi:hypothetical protein
LGGLVVVGIVEDFELDDDPEVVNVVMDNNFELDDVVLELVEEVVELVLLDVLELVEGVVLEIVEDVVLEIVEDVVLEIVELVVLESVEEVELDDLDVDVDVDMDEEVELVVLDDDGFELEVELVLELLDVVMGLPPTAIRLPPETTYTRLLPNIGRWNFARPTVPGTLVIGSSTPLVGTARKADNP